MLSMWRTTKTLNRQRGCAGLSVSLLLAYETIRFSHDEAHFSFQSAEFTIIMAIRSGFFLY